MYKGKRVLITGGASGIGRIMAEKLLKEGANVIVWDISQKNIDTTIEVLSDLGNISANIVDVSNTKSIDKAAYAVGSVDVLINNAGIVVGKSFKESTDMDIDKTMAINTNGVMYITARFLPSMLERGAGHICNIASSAGLISNPNMSIYVASKWAVVGWSDSLRLELKGSGVNVTTVLPYYINTGMFDGVKSRIPILKPEKVADTVLRSIKRGEKFRPIHRWLYHTVRLGQAILPVSIFDYIAGNIFGVYKTMDNFVGRKV